MCIRDRIADGNNYHLFSYTNGKFCSNEIKCIYRDTEGRMWIGTSGSGLNLCTPQDNYHSLKYEHYGTSEGLVNDVIQSVLGDKKGNLWVCLLYTSDAADEEDSVDLGGRRSIKKKKYKYNS